MDIQTAATLFSQYKKREAELAEKLQSALNLIKSIENLQKIQKDYEDIILSDESIKEDFYLVEHNGFRTIVSSADGTDFETICKNDSRVNEEQNFHKFAAEHRLLPG